jgi:hypothetical protein
MATMPSSRQLLTSLIESISAVTVDETEPAAQNEQTYPRGPPSNVLRNVHPAHRPLLFTLHVLFPTLLLPALDLLDRELVTRITYATSATTETSVAVAAEGGEVVDGDTNGCGSDNASDNTTFYLVRSVASTMKRREYGGGSAGGGVAASHQYMVQLCAWNCSCAHFTFEAFSVAAGRLDGQSRGPPVHEGLLGLDLSERTETWSFGGLSFDGYGADASSTTSVPCCKHILACLLAEKWAPLGRYVTERQVSREEIAGLIASL